MSYMSRTDSTRGAEAAIARGEAGPARPPSSKHRGVSWDKARSKWRAQILRNRVKHNLGHFAEEEEAAAAYRAADAALARGEELVPALHPEPEPSMLSGTQRIHAA